MLEKFSLDFYSSKLLYTLMVQSPELTDEQIKAILLAIQLGRVLQEDLPEIAEDYRVLKKLSEIERDYYIRERYSAPSDAIARQAVHYAVYGNTKGLFRTQAYEGLIPNDELEHLAVEHKRQKGRRDHEEKRALFARTEEQQLEDRVAGGQAAVEQHAGIHGMSSTQRSVYAQKRGRRCYEEGLALFARDKTTRQKDSHHAGRQSAFARGYTPWITSEDSDEHDLDEKDYVYALSYSPSYQHPNGRTNLTLIKEEVNRAYHGGREVRTLKAIQVMLSKYRLAKGK